MKILFVYPKFEKYLETFPTVSFKGAELLTGYSYPPSLGIAVLISITPPKHVCEFVDQNIEDVDYNSDADVIAISFFTPQAGNAYEICKKFRNKGKVVVVGGIHASVCREEAQRNADIVCIGEGEYSWLTILDDIEKKHWQKLYCQSTITDLNAMPLPARSVYYKKSADYDIPFDYLELSRGCNAYCDTCVVPLVSGRNFRFKSIDVVIRDFLSLQYPMCFITDDIVFMQEDKAARDYLLDLFTQIGRLGQNRGFYISNTALYPPDHQLLSVMKNAGATVSYFTFGFDPISNSILTGGAEKHRRRVIDQLKLIQDHGLLLYPAFHLGFDDQTVAVKDIILEFCRDAGIKMAQFCLRVPWPGTAMWKKIKAENRIIHSDWNRYNGSHVVFKPLKMTEKELENVLVELWKEFSYDFHLLYKLQRTAVVDNNSLAGK
jgi:radical SAM superfamily enzyme YgiQ (UPF0313 family)